MNETNILLVNPWISDFAAYDLWVKPLGLLYIGAFIKKYGYNISLLDFLDRERWSNKNNDETGKGKYFKTQINKPEAVKNIQRNFSLYGAHQSEITNHLMTIEKPTAILITSHMAYWYVGVQKSIELIKNIFPDIPIILGGIYVTLYEQHAHKNIDADYFVSGYGEKKTLKILDSLHKINRNYIEIPEFCDTNFLPYYFYKNIKTLPLLTSRGCPYNCSFCASGILNQKFSRRPVDNLIAEIKDNFEKYNITQYAFYDDALFFNKKEYIIPFLHEIIKLPHQFKFFSPNGLFAREINRELAFLMKRVGFSVIRLSLESTKKRWQIASSNKVSKMDFKNAIGNLAEAGYLPQEIEAYLIVGLPGQTFEDIRDSIDFVFNNSVITRLAFYTPIPGTADWQHAIDINLIDENIDPMLTNNTIYSWVTDSLTKDNVIELKNYANMLNNKLRSQEK